MSLVLFIVSFIVSNILAGVAAGKGPGWAGCLGIAEWRGADVGQPGRQAQRQSTGLPLLCPGQRVAMALFAPVEAAGARGHRVDHARRRARVALSVLSRRHRLRAFKVRDKYQAAGVTCTDATLAAIVATLFIAASGRKRTGCGR
jgi:hypothetical protein